MAAEDKRFVDYFPSYEIINSPVFNGMFFEPNRRSVNPRGVSYVMEHFFKSLEITKQDAFLEKSGAVQDAFCDEQLLEAFSDER
ncbi:GSCFA family protein [Halomonas cupida]|nr:GSCFA family protein [Halomonas cupida]